MASNAAVQVAPIGPGQLPTRMLNSPGTVIFTVLPWVSIDAREDVNMPVSLNDGI